MRNGKFIYRGGYNLLINSKLLSIVLFCLLISQAQAQPGNLPTKPVPPGQGNQPQFKWDVRLNTLSQGDKLGSKNLYPIILCTNDTERASLTTDGMFVLNYFLGYTGIVYHNNDGTFHSVLLDGDETKFLNATGEFAALPPDNDWQVSGVDMFNLNSGNVGVGVYPTAKFEVGGSSKINGGLDIRDYLQFTGTGLNKIKANSGLILIDGTKIGIGVNPDPSYTLNILGDCNLDGYLYVSNGVIIGKRIKSEKGLLDTILTKELAVEQKILTKEMQADTVTAVKMVTEKIEAVKDVKVSTITIDGINSKITSTSGSIDFGFTNLNTSKTVSAYSLITNELNATGTITANTLSAANLNVSGQTQFNILHVIDSVKIGNSIWLGGLMGNENNHIYTTSGNLYLQSQTFNQNTILNAYSGKVGIGTLNPQVNLHIEGETCIGSDGLPCPLKPDLSATVRLEDEVIINGTSERAAWWDFRVSGKDRNLLFRTSASDHEELNVMTLTEDGKVGIGTDNPFAQLSVYATETNIAQFIYQNHYNLPRVTITGSTNKIQFKTDYAIAGNVDLSFGTFHAPDALIIKEDGSVGIGITNPANKLDVCGTVRAKEIIVDEDDWCDYVFEDNYKRMTCEEREMFFKKNKHLPGIAPGKEIEENGLKIGNTMAGLTLNIEEISLNQIELYKIIKQQQEEIELLKKRLENIEQK
ncbi:MAG: hypothetical protein HY738_14220 [Bacteroidia bacterium]|nr:hypothetical protein [Bacteroidia bacterium]